MADARGVAFDIEPAAADVRGRRGPRRARGHEPARQRHQIQRSGEAGRASSASSTTRPSRIRACVIRDNGIGIPKSKLELIFDQFVRVHAHLDEELGAQGLGLGLSIVRESMEAMGGMVAVESAEGQGTTFILEWPACRRRRKRRRLNRRGTEIEAWRPLDRL